MGGAETHLGLYNELIVNIRAVRMERRTHPYGSAVVVHQGGLVLALPLLVPVAVLHLGGLVLHRDGECLHGGGKPRGVVLRSLHVSLETIGSLNKTLVGAFVAEGVDQHVAPEAGIVHSKCYLNIFHNS